MRVRFKVLTKDCLLAAKIINEVRDISSTFTDIADIQPHVEKTYKVTCEWADKTTLVVTDKNVLIQ